MMEKLLKVRLPSDFIIIIIGGSDSAHQCTLIISDWYGKQIIYLIRKGQTL